MHGCSIDFAAYELPTVDLLKAVLPRMFPSEQSPDPNMARALLGVTALAEIGVSVAGSLPKDAAQESKAQALACTLGLNAEDSRGTHFVRLMMALAASRHSRMPQVKEALTGLALANGSSFSKVQ
jgi:hypothetical protein